MQENTKKRVLHLITKGEPFGGAQHYVYTLATHLPQETYESIVLTGEGEELVTRLTKAGVHTEHIPYLGRNINPFGEVRAFIALVKRLKEIKPDILHTNSSKAGLFGALAGRIARVPRIIFTAHGWSSNEKRHWLIRTFFLILHWLTILLSDRTICVSKKTKNDMSGLSSLKDKTCVVYNGITDFETLSREDARAYIQKISNTKTTEVPLLGTISELHSNKGIDLIITALKDIKTPFLFFIIGGGEKMAELQTLIETYNLTEKVFLLGNIPNAKKYLKAFDIFTLTSRTEALPYTILEAGLVGIPILASRVGGISEIITNGVDGVLVRPNSEDIYQGLSYIISQPHKRMLYAQKLGQKIQNDFSLTHQISQTIKVYNGNF